MTRPGEDAAIEDAAAVVKELFGTACVDGRMGVTLDYAPCGRCASCTRDWRPEARAILAAGSGGLA